MVPDAEYGVSAINQAIDFVPGDQTRLTRFFRAHQHGIFPSQRESASQLRQLYAIRSYYPNDRAGQAKLVSARSAIQPLFVWHFRQRRVDMNEGQSFALK